MTDKDDITAIAAQGGNLNALLHCVLDDVRKLGQQKLDLFRAET